MTEQAEAKAINMVYVGKRLGNGGKLVHDFHIVGEDGVLSSEHYCYVLKGERARAIWIGGVFSIQMTGDRSIRGDFSYLHRYPDDSAIAGWVADERAAVAAYKARRDEKQEAKRDALAELLYPVRLKYQKLISTTDRLALDLTVLSALHKPVTREETKSRPGRDPKYCGKGEHE